MGQVQRYMEEIEARGWADVGTNVCSLCLSEPALVHAVRSNGATEVCDYCGQSPVAPDATAPIELILDLIVGGLRYEFEDPVEQVLYSSADGGYQMNLDDTRDLLESFEVTEDGELLRDLADAIQQDAWVQRDPYATTPSDALLSGWSSFREFVKHRRRYTFLVRDDTATLGAGDITMDDMPAALADAVEDAGQIRVLAAKTRWWRVRVHSAGDSYSLAKELGAPPSNWARDNRMSAKGVSAFYGASTPAGARAEVAGYADISHEGTIGEFELLRDVTVVDLTTSDDVPSLFDPQSRHRRAPLIFMRDFVADVAKIADPSDHQNLDYIPTQIVSEYFRFELSAHGRPVEGILWRSSKDESVQNCVLFADNEQMVDAGSETPNSLLGLIPGSVCALPAPL